jgi:hypothetical protein
MSKAMERFLNDFDEEVEAGRASALNRLEHIAIEMYDNWLQENNELKEIK